MPMNGISSGKDILLTISDNINGVVGTCRIKTLKYNQKVNARETQALDGITRHASFPNGWNGSVQMERTSNAIDTYVANYEQLYANAQTLPIVSFQFQVTEASGGISTYLHQNVVFEYSNAGEWKSDDFVTIDLDFKASNRLVLS